MGVLLPEPELPGLQPSVPLKATKQKAANSRPLRNRRRGRTPRKSKEARARRYLSNSLLGIAAALAGVVETVRVLEIGEPVICACEGLREQVGGLLGVPCP